MGLLEVDSLRVDYRTRRGSIRAVDDVSFKLEKGELLGLVGESGSGKSTLGLSIIRLVPPPGVIEQGSIRIDGDDIIDFSAEKMQSIRGSQISFIFQDPMTSLSPVKKISEHFIEFIRTHEPKTTKAEALKRANTTLRDVGILPERIADYPHQFSGGMRQRIMIALAITLNPEIVIADEPTTALDVIVQAKILDLLTELRDRYGMAWILITHDLSVVLERCDKILVMYAGGIVEYADSKELFRNPRHPYTQRLLQGIPNIEFSDQKLKAIPGSPPNLLNPPNGCSFSPRCSEGEPRCKSEKPQLLEVIPNHFVRCFKEM
ncbi:MAG: ABC transporter ATP-binding protein [Candidatus Bathyarchaeota archaeon]|nr:MAG: ABC transporter ATP-binding protein [Candidatus Bathyarchaeota archaeon]